jgi:hypothetical protein
MVVPTLLLAHGVHCWHLIKLWNYKLLKNDQWVWTKKLLCLWKIYGRMHYNDARCYKSLSGPILVWDFGHRHWIWDVMLFQLGQSTLVGVFRLLEHIELNMVEECVVTFGFGKDKDINSMANLIKPHLRRQREPNWNKVVSHHILLNKE